MLQVADRHKVSASFLARVCRRMRVPCPPRGYWARKRSGEAIRIPPLPDPRPGDEIEWGKGGGGKHLPAPTPSVQRTRTNPTKQIVAGEPGLHPHLEGVAGHFKAARELSNEYLKPHKLLMADIFVSKKIKDQAIEMTNQLYQLLESRGYRVGFSPIGEFHPRPYLHHCDGRKGEDSSYYTWTPARPTVVWIGTLMIGVTLFELSEEVEAMRVNHKYVRLTDIHPVKRQRLHDPYSWTSRHEFLTGRLAVRAYAPYKGVSWEKRWVEAEPGNLASMFEEIAISLRREANGVASKVKEAMEKQRQEHEEWERKQAAWRKEQEIREATRKREEAERARAKAIQDSTQDLLDFIHQWGQARMIREFFQIVEASFASLELERQAVLRERLAKARELIAEPDVFEGILHWKTPDERVPKLE